MVIETNFQSKMNTIRQPPSASLYRLNVKRCVTMILLTLYYCAKILVNCGKYYICCLKG